MNPTHSIWINKQPLRILFTILLAEWLMFLISGVGYNNLQGDRFFSIGVDPVYWIVFGLKIPQTILAHSWLGILVSGSTILLLLAIIVNPYNNKLAIALCILMFVFYITLTGYLTHRNFQAGFCWIFVPFLFKKEINRYLAFEATRYFLLFFYVSAAFLKIYDGALQHTGLFSQYLQNQFTPYYLEMNTGIRTSLNHYLVNHPSTTYLFYIISVVLESIVLVGFFTKKFDRWLALVILLFHLTNWFIMDIAPIGQLAFIGILFISRQIRKTSADHV
jgi:hypothetical protein